MKNTTRTQAQLHPALKILLTVAGLVLMALAAIANYSDSWLFAAHWKLFIWLPGMLERQYFFLPMWWFTLGLPLLVLAAGWLFPVFRRAVKAPWRSTKFALPMVSVLFLLAFSLFPWEYANTRACDTGSKMVFYLLTAGSGFALFLVGFYDKLKLLDRPMEQLYERVMSMDRRLFMFVTFGFMFLVTNVVALLVFEHLPRIQDSLAQLFQARIFAAGKLYLESPRFADFFDYTHIINNGQWYSQYPFMHSLLLLPFVFLGIPWIVNPLLGSLVVPAVYLLGREMYSERTGRLAAVLACVTPFLFNLSAEYMNHTSTLLFFLLFMLFFFRTLKGGRWHNILLAGLMLGLAANVRALSTLAVAMPFAAYGLYRAVREPKRLIPRFALMVTVAGAVTSLILVYNWLTNGDPLTFGYIVKWGAGHSLGFGRSGWGAQHTPFRGLVNTGNDWNLVNKFLFEWPIPALLPMGALFAGGSRNKNDWLLLATFLCLSGAYYFYWFHNVCFGPRFLFEAMGAFILLTVRGGENMAGLLRRTFKLNVTDRSGARFIGRVTPLMVLVMIVVGLPPLMGMYHVYGGFDSTLLHNVKKAGLKNALVFCYHLGPGFTQNSLNLDGDVVYAKDFGLLNSALTIAYPDREYYYANKDTLRPLTGIDFPKSRLKRALEEMATFIAAELPEDCRTVIWPFGDIPPPGWVRRGAAFASVNLIDFRELSREIFAGRRQLDDYLPAVSCWMLNDGREHLRIFAFMNDLQNYIADRYKFTLLYVTEEGTASVYDIRLTTGDETQVSPQRGAVPIR